jgi:hypothetical protein
MFVAAQTRSLRTHLIRIGEEILNFTSPHDYSFGRSEVQSFVNDVIEMIILSYQQ